MKLRTIVVLMIAYLVVPATWAADRCTGLLQDGIRNKLSERYSQDFLDEFHSALCSEKSNRIDAAKSKGLSLGYGDFVFDFAGSSKKIGSYQESMCSSRDRINAGQTFYEQVRNHVDVNLVSGFNECIRITEGGMDYEVKEGKEGDSITIDVSYSRTYAPRAALSVTHLVINPSELKDKVVCEGPLATVLDGNTVNITQAVGVQSVTCRPGDAFPREGDNEFSIVLHTTVGTIEGFVKPFYKGKSDRLAVLEEKYESASEQISNLNSGLSSANSSISSVNGRFSKIKFHKACVAREANGCNPVMPPCPGGWIDTGIDEVNTWVGGSCGHGNLCRVCYKVE